MLRTQVKNPGCYNLSNLTQGRLNHDLARPSPAELNAAHEAVEDATMGLFSVVKDIADDDWQHQHIITVLSTDLSTLRPFVVWMSVSTVDLTIYNRLNAGPLPAGIDIRFSVLYSHYPRTFLDL